MKPVKIVFFLLVFSTIFLNDLFADYQKQKEFCTEPFGIDWNTSDEAKEFLINFAKCETVEDLFGDMIRKLREEIELSEEDIGDIKQYSSEYIRIEGSPQFFNGSEFGKLCVKINAYVIEDDVKLFRPHFIEGKTCIPGNKGTVNDIRDNAIRLAKIKAVKNFRPGLSSISDEMASLLVHEVKVLDASFIPKTDTFCAEIKGIVYPVELHASANELTHIRGDRLSTKTAKLLEWEVSADKLSWNPVTLPHTRWGCDYCTRFYRAKIKEKPVKIRFRWASDNQARLWLNGTVIFDDFWIPSYCGDKKGPDAKCCYTTERCLQGLTKWYDLEIDKKILNDMQDEKYFIWEVREEWGGEGFHTEMEIMYR